MRGKLFGISGIFVLAILCGNVCAEQLILKNEQEIRASYTEYVNREKEFLFYKVEGSVRVNYIDMNGDGKTDIVIANANSYDRDTGYVWRIFLNIGEEGEGPYCLSADSDDTFPVDKYACVEDGWDTPLHPLNQKRKALEEKKNAVGGKRLFPGM
ncbi:MAG: FG-GAP repeat protein [bacterium]|nr:FG-GAP repeat protein [bacterium]